MSGDSSVWGWEEVYAWEYGGTEEEGEGHDGDGVEEDSSATNSVDE